MCATQLTPSQNSFVAAITEKVSTTLGTKLPGKFEMVSYPPGFHPAVQYGASAYYNSTMLDVFNGMLEVGSNGMLTLGNSQFSTTYYKILTNATYQYSTADNKVVQDPSIANQQISVVTTATSGGFVAAYGVTPVTYQTVIAALLKNFSAAPTDWSTSNISAAASTLGNAGFASLQAAIANAVQQLSPLNTILGAQAAANAELAAALANTQKPSAANGGLPINATDFYVGWTPMPDNNTIQGGLDSTSSVTIKIAASNLDSSSASVSIAGKTGFSVPIFDIVDIGITASSSYNWTKNTTSASSMEMSIEYPGMTIVQIDPLTLSADYAKGWYDETLLKSIVDGSGNPDVSGFKIDPSNQYAVSKMFGPGKAFSRLRTCVISQAPTITMTFSADQATSVMSSFKEQSSTSVKLFGLFSVGSFDQSYSITKVHQESASGTVTVTMAPPAIKGTIAPEKQVCNVLGGVALYPPA